MVTITLEQDEALVLHDFLSRFEDSDVLSINDPAERYALWLLNGRFEKALAAPFRADYANRLRRARADIRKRYDNEGGSNE